MKTTPIFIAAFIVGVSAVVGLADTKDTWQLKMNLKNGETKTLLLESIDSIVLGGAPEKEVKPGDVDANGVPLLMDVSYNHYYEWVWYHDNMGNNTYPVVERTRTFSDGTVITDEFFDYGHPYNVGGAIHANYGDGSVGCGSERPGLSHTLTPQDYTLFRDDATLYAKYDVIDGIIPTLGERYVVNSGDVEIKQSETEISCNITHSIGVDYLNGLYIWSNYETYFNIYAPYGKWNSYGASSYI